MLVDEHTLAKVNDYERSDLSERHKVMLRLLDAYLIDPRRLFDDELVRHIFEHYTREQVVALIARALNYTSQKDLVVLGIDVPYTRGTPIGVTVDGYRLSDYHNYINNIQGDVTRLPTEKRTTDA